MLLALKNLAISSKVVVVVGSSSVVVVVVAKSKHVCQRWLLRAKILSGVGLWASYPFNSRSANSAMTNCQRSLPGDPKTLELAYFLH